DYYCCSYAGSYTDVF
nr:immunoglobulin light chain junction region [Macaca mulatta]MOW56852.1 immunoglobulin light chain junction region [Macaca mulatta]MOW57027.1 immunoglobulin light chain junction region [Macaca mulatta]MOW57059.1 immunoglobulin light chain junction region [Macaca mulatta]MOW57446.1 immunoglobulin light chain junction region [Macaca mulatta]